MCLAFLGDPVVADQVSRLFESTEKGTPSSRVVRLSKWGYQFTYRSSNLDELDAWLQEGKAPIVIVRTGFLNYWPIDTLHAVVMVGIENGLIYLNDPAFDFAPQICSLDEFLAAWAERDEAVALIER